MRRIVLTLIAFFSLAGLFYGLGLGPFKEGVPQGNRPKRSGERAVTVEVGEVRLGDIEERISAVGPLLPRASVMVAPKTAGRVEEVSVDVGERVKKGQLLARLDRRELAEEVREAEASLKVSEASLKGKEAELEDLKRKLERSKALFAKNFISRQEVDTLESQVFSATAQVELTRAQIAQMKARLENARLRLADTEVVSPFAGHVGKRFVDPGAVVNASTPIVNVVDLSWVKVLIPVVEKDYRKVRLGSAASLTVDAYAGQRFVGKVVRIAPVLSEETRTAQVEIEIANSQPALKPGMFAKVEITVEKRRGVPLVPDGALIKMSEGYGLFKIQGAGSTAEFVIVKTGLSDQGWTEVQGPVKPGDRVVTVGSNLLRDGQKVRIAEGAPRAKPKGEGL